MKKILSIVLALCLCLSLLPAAVLAEGGADVHTAHCVCGATHTAVGDHTDDKSSSITWQPWTGVPSASGYYYLTADVTLSAMWTISNGQDIVLCLNGKTLTADNQNVGDTITIEGTLTITDCKGTGKITGTNPSTAADDNNHKVLVVSTRFENCTLNLYGGTITGIHSGRNYDGGGVRNEGTFNMYGGTITGNSAQSGGGVNNVYNRYNSSYKGKGEFNFYGGIISGNTNKGGSNNDIRNDKNSTFYANGGTVAGPVYNYGTITKADGYIGTTFNGNVTNNSSGIISGGTYNGTVTNESGSTVSGSVTNNGAFVFKSGSTNSANITGTGYIQTASGALTDNRDEPLTGTVTVSTASALASAVKAEDVTTIKLGGSFALDNTLKIPSGRTITLDLNGQTLSMLDTTNGASYFMIENYGDLTIKDSGTDGKLSFKSEAPENNSPGDQEYVRNRNRSTIANAGKLTVKSGTIENATESSIGTNYAKYVIDTLAYSANTEINIQGGTLSCSTGTAIRQIPRSTTYTNTLNISGGNITGRNAVITQGMFSGGCLATVNISGGILTGTWTEPYAYYTYYDGKDYHSGTEINISGGIFNGCVFIFNGCDDSDKTDFAGVSITGGNFNSQTNYDDICIYTSVKNDEDKSIPALTGGTYAHEPYDEYVAEGYIARQKPDGTYEVVAKNASSTGDELAWLLPVIGALDKEPFDDVTTGDWFYDDVHYVNENGLMTGTASRTFSPDAPVTRGMVMTILARREGIKTDRYSPWYAAGVEWAVVNGISDGSNPEAPITREELATMLYRYAKLKGYDVSVGADTNILSFLDALEISDYAFEPLQWAVGGGLINGAAGVNAGKLLPQSTATRAQLAAMLHRFFG